MNTIVCFAVAVMAVVAADEGFYQQQSAPSASNVYANYNKNYDYQQPPRQQGLWDRISTSIRRQQHGLWDRLSTNIRRQGLGGLLGGLGLGLGGVGPIVGVVVAVVVIIVVVAGLGYVVNELNSSGRGLDTDQWEVNHSVWMDQLQKDFEDSWSVE